MIGSISYALGVAEIKDHLLIDPYTLRKELIMRQSYRTLTAIEYAFVVSLLASFGVLSAGGFLFGFQISQWIEWQGILVGVIATIAGVVGAIVGLRIAPNEN